MYCGFCGSYGCEVGAKSSSLVTFIALAEKTGKLTLRTRTQVVEVTTNAAGAADGVTYIDERSSQVRARARARVVVVACSPIETARLLLASGKAKGGLANASGLVGKNLMFSTASSGWGQFAKPNPAFPAGAERLPFVDRTVRDARGTILFMRPHINPIFQAERIANESVATTGVRLFGTALKKRLKEFFVDSHLLEWETFSEYFPSAKNEVTLDPELKDRFGRAVARYRVAVHPQALAASDGLAKLSAQMMDAAGAHKKGLRADVMEDRTYPMLQAGTTRMGKDPKRSVLDAKGQAHDVKNLYVADGSSFPSVSGAPFTLTIMANGLRVGAEIVKQGKSGDL